MGNLKHFLVTFEPRGRRLLDVKTFDDEAQADLAFRLAEEMHRDDPTQVVMLSALSLEEVKATHPHYFAPQPSAPGGEKGFALV